MLPHLPEEYAQGIYATPATYEAVIRYSNGMGRVRPDALFAEETRYKWLHDFLTNAGELAPDKWLWDELLSILSFTSIQPRNLLSYSYWSMAAVRHGEYIVKIRTKPLTAGTNDDVNFLTTPEAHRTKLIAEAGERDHQYAVQVQLSKHLKTREEHKPLGEIVEIRREVYCQSSITRHTTNNQERREPTSLKDLFG
ncbi:hypothetical protein [Actinocrispum sp. NPDC049592]|uniref:hypothetical protein n=1 Tax=Actinocrispum sp. NPDC049592 TaxID=3154835 RepID=UPI003422AB62